MRDYIEKIKIHIEKHKMVYSCAATAVGVAGITALIMRGLASQSISSTIGGTADRTIGVVGKKVVIGNLSYISADRKGPPSWVIRCKETGEVFTSQRQAAFAMDLPQDHISNHLNGLREHVQGNHFERICLAA